MANPFSNTLALALVDDAVHFSTPDPASVLVLPAYVAVETASNRVLAIGEEARAMVGRTPAHITVLKLLAEGMPAEWEPMEAFLREGLVRLHAKSLWRPRPTFLAAVRGSVAARRVFMQLAVAAG